MAKRKMGKDIYIQYIQPVTMFNKSVVKVVQIDDPFDNFVQQKLNFPKLPKKKKICLRSVILLLRHIHHVSNVPLCLLCVHVITSAL